MGDTSWYSSKRSSPEVVSYCSLGLMRDIVRHCNYVVKVFGL